MVERFVEALPADVFGLRPVKIVEPEIDISLAKYSKPVLVAEVK